MCRSCRTEFLLVVTGVRGAQRLGVRVADHRLDAGRPTPGNGRGRRRGYGRGDRGPVPGRRVLAFGPSVQPVRHVLDADRRSDSHQGECRTSSGVRRPIAGRWVRRFRVGVFISNHFYL